MMGMGLTHGLIGYLIASGVGYWVLTQSQKEKNNIKKVGQLLGIAIIALSVVGAACKVYCLAQMCKTGNCAMGVSCPFTGKAAPPMQK